MGVQMWSFLAVAGLSGFAGAVNDIGSHPIAPFNVFHPIHPTIEQVGNYSSGVFMDWYMHKGWRRPFWYSPPSPYECRYRDNPLLASSSFSCEYTALQTPEDIFEAKNRIPECLHVENIGDVAYERLQWATWTHSCWHKDGRPNREREIVLWQHDMAVYQANREIAMFIAELNAHVAMRIQEQDAMIQMLMEECDEKVAEIRKKKPLLKALKIKEERDKLNKKIKQLKKKLNLEGHKKAMEKEFWVKSWPARSKIPQLDHLVGPYFERRMRRNFTGGFDWLGFGEPNPKEPLYPNGITWTPEGVEPTYFNQSIEGSGIPLNPQVDRKAVIEAINSEAAMIKAAMVSNGPAMLAAANVPLPEAMVISPIADLGVPAREGSIATTSTTTVSPVDAEAASIMTPAPTPEDVPLITARNFWGSTSAPWHPPSPEEWSSLTRHRRTHWNYAAHHSSNCLHFQGYHHCQRFRTNSRGSTIMAPAPGGAPIDPYGNDVAVPPNWTSAVVVVARGHHAITTTGVLEVTTAKAPTFWFYTPRTARSTTTSTRVGTSTSTDASATATISQN